MSANVTPVSGQGTWETTLQGRDLDGNLATAEAYYDAVLGITWLADANYAQTSGYDADGRMDWATANVWAAGLNFNGITGWRLSNTNPVDGMAYDYNLLHDGTSDSGYNISAPGTTYAGSTGSELAHIFYNTLGNLALYDTSGSPFQPGWGLSNTGAFSKIQSNPYWSATEYPGNDIAWFFSFNSGSQSSSNEFNLKFAWAVHDGDVGAAIILTPQSSGLSALDYRNLSVYPDAKKRK
jgi:hypothetical protein